MSLNPDSRAMIVTCLQQKIVIMKNILDITKEIEVQANQPELALGDLLVTRENWIERVDKCDRLIQQELSSLPEETIAQWDCLLTDKPCSLEEEDIRQMVAEFRGYLQRVLEIDKRTMVVLNEQKNKMKIELSQPQKQPGMDTLFHT